VEISLQPGIAPSTSYSFDLLDAQGKMLWTGVIAAPPTSDSGDQRITLAIPGAMLQNGSYIVAVSGVGLQGERTPIERYVFAVRLIN
jgi:predicted amidohydrolase